MINPTDTSSEPGLRPAPACRRRGISTIETVLVLMILLGLSFGTVEFGYYFFVRNSMQASVREGVRKACVAGATQAQVTTAVNNSLNTAGLNSGSYTITTSPTNITTAVAGTMVTVTVTASWGTVGNGLSPMKLISSTKSMTASAVMRKEG